MNRSRPTTALAELPARPRVTRFRPAGKRNAPSAMQAIEIPGAFEDGVLPRSLVDSDLTVNVRWWDGVQASMTLRLYWDDDEIGMPYRVSADEADDPASIFSLIVPQAVLAGPDGAHMLYYTSSSFPGGEPQPSPSIRVEIDRTAPGGSSIGAINFPESWFLEGVSADDLVDGALEGRAPDYFDKKVGDILTPWLGIGTPAVGDFLPGSAYPVDEDDFGREITLRFPLADLEAIGDGILTFSYDLTDKAGNRSAIRARDVPLEVIISEAPEDIQPPLVPSNDDGLITDADARAPVEVQIPQFTNAMARDQINVRWGPTHRASPAYLSEDDLGNDPMIGVPVPYAVLSAAGEGAIDVFYEVRRGRVLVGTSDATRVAVDLSLPGGEDPDPETPVHENLRPLEVTSASGESNKIPPGDFDEEATATIPWLAEDDTEALAVDDVIQVYWGTETLPPYTVLTTDEPNDIELPVSPEIMDAAGASMRLPVYYTVTRALSTAPHESTSRAPIQEVEVVSPGDLPGGEDGLGLGKFTGANDDNALSRSDVETPVLSGNYHSTPFRIDSYTNIKVDDHIELFFIGSEGYAGTGPVIEASRYEPTHDINLEDMGRGYYEFQIPPRIIMTICTVGSAAAWYRVTARESGLNARSEEASVLIDVKMPSEPTCPVVPETPGP